MTLPFTHKQIDFSNRDGKFYVCCCCEFCDILLDLDQVSEGGKLKEHAGPSTKFVCISIAQEAVRALLVGPTAPLCLPLKHSRVRRPPQQLQQIRRRTPTLIRNRHFHM